MIDLQDPPQAMNDDHATIVIGDDELPLREFAADTLVLWWGPALMTLWSTVRMAHSTFFEQDASCFFGASAH